MADRAELDARFAALDADYAGVDIPRPSHWGGFRVVPDRLEFWQGRANRVHDRLEYRRDGLAAAGWRVGRLAP